MTLGEIIKTVRKKKGLSQKNLAALLNTTPQNLAQYENNRRKPKLDTLRKMTEAMNVSLHELTKLYPEIFNYYSPDEWHNHAIKWSNELTNKFKNLSTEKQGFMKQASGLYQQHAHNVVDSDARTALLLNSFEKLNIPGRMASIHLLNAFEKLNTTGRSEALKRVSELTEIKKYTDPDDAPAPDPDHKEN